MGSMGWLRLISDDLKNAPKDAMILLMSMAISFLAIGWGKSEIDWKKRFDDNEIHWQKRYDAVVDVCNEDNKTYQAYLETLITKERTIVNENKKTLDKVIKKQNKIIGKNKMR